MAADTEELVIDIPTGEIPVPGSDSIPVRADPESAPRKTAAKSDTDRLARLVRERDSLQQERDTERAARARAESEVVHARDGYARASDLALTRENQAMHAHWAKINADLDNLKSASSATQLEAETAQQAYVAASEVGDHQKAAEAQRRMAKAESQLSQLENGKIAAERQIEETRSAFQRVADDRQRPAPRPETVAQPEKPISPDAWIDGARTTLGDDGAEWLRENREYVTDPDKNAAFIAYATYYGKTHGQSALKSEEFREALDSSFANGRDEDADPVPKRRENGGRVETVRPKATSSAPVSRAGNVFSSRNLNAGAMRAPPDIVRFCKEAGLDVAKYMLSARDDVIKGDKPKEWLDPDYDRGIS